jgi:monovalent cation:H+ antiporter-2, CPA2 family
MPELGLLRDLIVLFGLGVCVVLVFHRLKLPPIVGFLMTGVLCGPYGFGLIAGVHQVEAMAEIGVVLLLFTVGIEFSIQDLIRLRTFLLLGGGLQVLLTLASIGLIARAGGESWRIATFLGMLVALSSTAIVIRLFADRGELDAPHGRAALAMLIFQDLCVVPMMLLTPLLGGAAARPTDILLIAAKAVGFVVAAVVAARLVVPWVLHHVVNTRKREVFLLTIILLCVGTAWASAQVGLSLALGAFIAGLIISDSEYSHQALGEILPLREVFNSLFFVSIGMLFDVRTVLQSPAFIASAIIATLLIKAIVTTGVTWAMGQPLRVALLAGIAIAQIGEFSFVLSKVGLSAGLLDERLYQLFLAVAVGTMTVTPLLMNAAPTAAAFAERHLPKRIAAGRQRSLLAGSEHPQLNDHVIIIGYGLNGRNLARVLSRVGVSFTVIEMNPENVRSERRRGRPIIYGDATRQEVLEYAGIHRARVVVIAISDAAATRSSVALARRLNPRVHIVVRTRYVQEMEPLFALGTDEVVPEEFETSVEIFSRVLTRYLVPRDEIDRQIRSIRQDAYETFRTMSEEHAPATGLQRFLADLSLEVYRLEPGSPLVGRPLESSGIRDASGATVAAIQPVQGEVVVNPKGSAILGEGDIVLLLGRPEQLTAASKLFSANGKA